MPQAAAVPGVLRKFCFCVLCGHWPSQITAESVIVSQHRVSSNLPPSRLCPLPLQTFCCSCKAVSWPIFLNTLNIQFYAGVLMLPWSCLGTGS